MEYMIIEAEESRECEKYPLRMKVPRDFAEDEYTIPGGRTLRNYCGYVYVNGTRQTSCAKKDSSDGHYSK